MQAIRARAKSMIRYLPPKGTAGLARFFVSGKGGCRFRREDQGKGFALHEVKEMPGRESNPHALSDSGF